MFLDYLESGFSIVPLEGKACLITGWSQYNKVLPSEELAAGWDRAYPNGNWGMCLGPASGVIAIDIDSIDPAIHALVPPSSCTRTGRPGREVRLYKHTELLASRMRSEKFPHLGIEIFVNNGQVVIPPSIHPEIKSKYLWTGRVEPLDFNFREQLTEITNFSWLHDLLVKRANAEARDGFSCEGRNNKLTSIACAMYHGRIDSKTAAAELYEYDSMKHNPPYFSDIKEMWAKKSGGNPKIAAILFVENQYARLKGKRR